MILSMKFYYIIIGFVIFLIFVIIKNIITSKIKYKKLYDFMEQFSYEKDYKFSQVKNHNYDFLLENNKNHIYIKFVYVPHNSCITINSKDTWKLSYGRKNNPGKGYPNHRYLTELQSFLNWNIDKENSHKIILVYPKIDKIQRYLNESEIEIINYRDKFYGYRVMSLIDFESHFEDLL
jgi:hypothetical protein